LEVAENAGEALRDFLAGVSYADVSLPHRNISTPSGGRFKDAILTQLWIHQAA
jgi:hypothetical protein